MLIQKRLLSLFALLLGLMPAEARAFPFLFPTVYESTEAGLSQTNARGAAATLMNPGGLIVESSSPRRDAAGRSKDKRRKDAQGFSLWEAYADLSILQFKYSYQREGYDSFSTSGVVPPVNFGLRWKPNQRFAAGLFFIPRPGSKPTAMKNVPFPLSTETIVIDAEILSASSIFALGFSHQLNSDLSLGVSVVETTTATVIKATPHAIQSETPLLQQSSLSSTYRYLVGALLQKEDWLLGLSFSPFLAHEAQSDYSLAGSEPIASTEKQFFPTSLSVGGEFREGRLQVALEYQFENWAQGREHFGSEAIGGAQSKDYLNTHSFVGATRYVIDRRQTVNLALGYYPANSGVGDKISGGSYRQGLELGKFEGLNRQVFAAGFSRNSSKSNWRIGINHVTGFYDVPKNYSMEGQHRLSVLTIVIGGGRSF